MLCEHFVLNEIMARQQSRESRIGATNGTKTFPTARVDYELLKKLDAHGKQLMAVDAGPMQEWPPFPRMAWNSTGTRLKAGTTLR